MTEKIAELRNRREDLNRQIAMLREQTRSLSSEILVLEAAIARPKKAAANPDDVVMEAEAAKVGIASPMR